MTREPATLCHPSPPREMSTALGPVLIQVPALAARVRDESRPRRPIRQRRRRLRREVRLAGSALLLGLPLVAAVMLGGARTSARSPDGTPGSRVPASAAVEAPPMVSIAMPIETDAAVPLRELVPPVQFPDYVLPDDGSEEATHAGS